MLDDSELRNRASYRERGKAIAGKDLYINAKAILSFDLTQQ